jgi:hypothetical protein
VMPPVIQSFISFQHFFSTTCGAVVAQIPNCFPRYVAKGGGNVVLYNNVTNDNTFGCTQKQE